MVDTEIEIQQHFHPSVQYWIGFLLSHFELPRNLKTSTVFGIERTNKGVVIDSIQVGTFEDCDSAFVTIPLGNQWGVSE